jgi:EAL domain-containing protein (putative c-di-GMP-specific phosphodiesterase class I)
VMAELLKNADQAMYAAKNLGRNRFNYFTADMQAATLARLQLIKELRVALGSGQFELYFQPIVDLTTGQFVKAEALLRWHHPTRGLVCPAEFIAVAEDTGLINEIGEWVFREAAHWVARCPRPDGRPFQVSVNKSPVQFLTGNIRESWLEYLEELGLPGEAIVIEVTERVLLSDRPEILEELSRLRQAGISLAIDDFGTGFSALYYLKKFDVDYLKIDRVFIRGLGTDPDDRALVEAIIVMAHKLGIQVIAEGVETTEQRDWLIAAGCDYAQGFLFAQPLPASQIGW